MVLLFLFSFSSCPQSERPIDRPTERPEPTALFLDRRRTFLSLCRCDCGLFLRRRRFGPRQAALNAGIGEQALLRTMNRARCCRRRRRLRRLTLPQETAKIFANFSKQREKGKKKFYAGKQTSDISIFGLYRVSAAFLRLLLRGFGSFGVCGANDV